MNVDRRTVLRAGGTIAAAGVLAACSSSEEAAAPAASAEPAPAAGGEAPSAGAAPAAAALVAVADIPVGSGVIIPEPPVVVTQPAEGDFRAFTAICPHQGCLVSEVADNEILCACHGSLFSAVDGAVLEGPAREGLTPEEIVVDDAGGISLA